MAAGSQARARRARILEALLARHGCELRAQAARHAGRPADADDALQDACLSFLRSFDGAEGRQAIGYLMLAIKHCAWAIGNRAARSRERGFEDFRSPPSASPCDLTEILPDCGPSPSERADEVEELAGRRELLATLKPDQRCALILFAGGYSYREIATIRGWTHTKVNRSIAEGRAALRAQKWRA